MPRKSKKQREYSKKKKTPSKVSLFVYPPENTPESIAQMKDRTFNAKSLSVEELLQETNMTERELFDEFNLHFNVVETDDGSFNFYKRKPDPYTQQLFDFYNRPDILGYVLYHQKINKYVIDRYKEWSQENGYIYGEGSNTDPKNRIINHNFDHSYKSDVYLLADLPPEYNKYNRTDICPELVEMYGNANIVGFTDILIQLTEYLLACTNADELMEWVDKRPTISPPWAIWDEYQIKVKAEVEARLDANVAKRILCPNANDDSLMDMTIDDSIYSTEGNNESVLLNNKKTVLGESSKHLNDGNLPNDSITKIMASKKDDDMVSPLVTPDISMDPDSSLVKIILSAYKTPAFTDSPNRSKLNNIRTPANRPSILVKQSVKKSARKKIIPSSKIGSKPARLNLDSSDSDTGNTPKASSVFKNRAHLKSTPMVNQEKDGNKNNSDDHMNDSDFENDFTPIPKRNGLPSSSKEFNTAREIESSTLEGESSTIENITMVIPESKKPASTLSNKYLSGISEDLHESEGRLEGLPEEEDDNDSNDTDVLMQEVNNQNNSNPIFNNPNLVQKLRAMNISPELDTSGEDFTELINKNKKTAVDLFSNTNNITLNSKMTPIPTGCTQKNNDYMMDSPVNSPLMKKSKPSSTPNPFSKNQSSSKLTTSCSLNNMRSTPDNNVDKNDTVVLANKSTMGCDWVHSPTVHKKNKHASGQVRRSTRLSTLSKSDNSNVADETRIIPNKVKETLDLNDSVSSRPAAGLVSKMAEKFNKKDDRLAKFKNKMVSKNSSKNAFQTKEPVVAKSMPSTKPKSFTNPINKSSNLKPTGFMTHKKVSEVDCAEQQTSSGGNLVSKSFFPQSNLNNPKTALDKAKEIKAEKLKKQKEKDEKERQRKIKKAEEDKKALELKKQKNKEQREAVRKRREEKERQEQEFRQRKQSASKMNTSSNYGKLTNFKEKINQLKSGQSSSKINNNNSMATSSSTTSNQILKVSNIAKERAMNGKVGEIDPADLMSSSDTEQSDENNDNYDMTFDRPPIAATEFDYKIDDLNSGDETDDDENPKKQPASWAVGPELFAACNNMYKCASDPNNAFDLTCYWPVASDFNPGDLDVSSADASIAPDGEEANICPLYDIFEDKKDKFFRRGSTGIWKKPPRG